MADIRKLDRDPAAEQRTVVLYRHTLAYDGKRWQDDSAVASRYSNAVAALEALESILEERQEELYEFVEGEDGE